jgi:hypothetical protein
MSGQLSVQGSVIGGGKRYFYSPGYPEWLWGQSNLHFPGWSKEPDNIATSLKHQEVPSTASNTNLKRVSENIICQAQARLR